MKFKKVWMLGGDTKNEELDDYITAYVSETDVRIECQHGFSWQNKWYEVEISGNVHYFDTLKEAKAFVETM